jgi:hypothetical protein
MKVILTKVSLVLIAENIIDIGRGGRGRIEGGIYDIHGN